MNRSKRIETNLPGIPEDELVPVVEPLFVEVVHRDATVPLASAREQDGLESEIENLLVQLQAGGDR